eukprot:754508-Hanusia_phi.AAC.2
MSNSTHALAHNCSETDEEEDKAVEDVGGERNHKEHVAAAYHCGYREYPDLELTTTTWPGPPSVTAGTVCQMRAWQLRSASRSAHPTMPGGPPRDWAALTGPGGRARAGSGWQAGPQCLIRGPDGRLAALMPSNGGVPVRSRQMIRRPGPLRGLRRGMWASACLNRRDGEVPA